MALQIVVNQSGKPAGVAGRAREDLALGSAVTLSATGGPFSKYRWSIVSKPIDVVAAARSTVVLATPTQPSTVTTALDVIGTYLIEVSVDSGYGLGALDGDVARLTFYAGPSLASDPRMMPRRVPAFGERTEHNAPDAVDPQGNVEGHARELARWFAAIADLYEGRLWAGGLVRMNAPAATTLVRSRNVASVAYAPMTEDFAVTFATALPDSNYGLLVTPIQDVNSSADPVRLVIDEQTKSEIGFRVKFFDSAGAPCVSGFYFRAEMGIG